MRWQWYRWAASGLLLLCAKDSLDSLFSHRWLTPYRRAFHTRSVFSVHWALCAELCVVTGLWAGCLAAGVRASSRAPKACLPVSLPFWNFRRLSHIPSLTTPPHISLALYSSIASTVVHTLASSRSEATPLP